MYINLFMAVPAGSVSSGAHHSSGLGTVAMLATLALVGFLAGVIVPACKDVVEKRELSDDAGRISLFLHSVTAQAVQRDRHALVSYEVRENGAWCLGATIETSPCDCMETNPTGPNYCRLDSSRSVMSESDLESEMFLPAAPGGGHLALDPARGPFVDPQDSIGLGLQSQSQAYQIQLRLFANGRISVCATRQSRDIRPFKPCSRPQA